MGSTSTKLSGGAVPSAESRFVKSEAAYAQGLRDSTSRNKADPRPPVSHAQAKEMMRRMLHEKLQEISEKKALRS